MIYRAYGELRDVPHVVVDGSAQPGTVLTLSHWPGSATPDRYRADLSAEIAFNYAADPDPSIDVEFVTNNHFDQDGLVGVYALTDPDAAFARHDRLVDVARAGDFGSFHHRDSVRAAIAIANLGTAGNGDAYGALLPRLAEIVDHPERFEDLWAEEDAHITETERALADGTITITEDAVLDLAVVRIPADWEQRTIHRFTMVANEAAHSGPVHNATNRFVLVTLGSGAPELRYRYETWIHYLSRRPRPRVDLTDLADELTAEESGAGRWVFDGVEGLSPALHLVGAERSSVDPETFVDRVTDTLRRAAHTWSPYPED